MPPKSIMIDHDRAKRVVEILLDAWRRKLPPFDRVVPVPSVFPKNLVLGSVQHALYLFDACYWMRGKMNSVTALVKLAKVYENEQWLFEPGNFKLFRKDNPEELEMRDRIRVILSKHGLGFNAKETAKFWVRNSRKLARFWEGNPLLLYEKASSYEDFCHIMMDGKEDEDSSTGFLCFRHKMTSMVIYFWSRGFLIDPFSHPGPADFHNDRLGLSLEMLVDENLGPGSEYTFEVLSAAMREIYKTHVPDPKDSLEFAEALWYLSRMLCSMSQGNSSSISDKYEARRTQITVKKVSWDKGRERRYNASCGICPVESLCKWSIPSADNYIRGAIQIRGLRPKPHEFQESLLEVPRALETRGPVGKKIRYGNDIRHENQVTLLDD